jgi:N4-gp56 family major capsid protein
MAGGWFTTNTQADDVLTTWINKKFVSDLEFDLQYQKFTEKAIIPDNGGNIGRFVTFSPPVLLTGYALGTAALTEGNTGSEHEITSITTTGVELTIAEFGEWYRLGKLASMAEASGTAQKIQKRMNDGAALGIDGRVLAAGPLASTNYAYAVLAAPGAVTTAPATIGRMGASSIIVAHKVLRANLAKGFRGVENHPEGHFAAIITPQAELDMVTEVSTTKVAWSAAVTNVPGRMGQEKWVNGYIGSIYGTACYVTQNFSTTSLTSTVELNYVIADGGIGAMAFGDMNPSIIFNDINSPYKNVKSIAWYALFQAKLIDSARVVKLYSLQ